MKDAGNSLEKKRRRTRYSIFLLLFSCLILFIIFFYNQSQKDTQREIDTISNYYSDTNVISKFKAYHDTIDPAVIENNPDLQYAYKVNQLFYRNDMIEKENILALDSLSRTKSFEEASDLNKFYNLYYIAFAYSVIMETKKGLEYFNRANKYIENDFEKYQVEHHKLQRFLNYLSTFYSKSSERYEKYQLKLIEDAKKKNDSVIVATYAYAVAYDNSERGDFEIAKKYNEMATIYLDDEASHTLYGDIRSNAVHNFYELNEIDNVNKTYREMEENYKKGMVSKEEFDKFVAWFYFHSYGHDNVPHLYEKADSMITEISTDCYFRIPQYLLHHLSAKIMKDRKQVEKEIYHLEKMYHYLNECGDSNQYFFHYTLETTQELIKKYDEIGDEQNKIKWYDIKENILEVKENNQLSYTKMIEFLTDREVDFAERNVQLQEKDIRNKNLIIIITITFLVVVIASLLYIIQLYRGNKRYQKNIEKNNELLDEQNKKILSQKEEVDELVDQLKDSNQSLQNFAKVAAHDIKSPIASMRQAIVYLENKYENMIDSTDKKLFDYLDESSKNLTLMIGNILEYSYYQKDEIRKEDIDMNEMVESTLRSLRKEIEDANAKIIVQPNLPHIQGNVLLLKQLFQNLISNALKYHVEGKRPVIEIGVFEQNQNEVTFYIKDNGIGVDESEQEEIFKIFHRSQKSSNIDGSGIGLATGKKIIEYHGGEIWIESKINEGTTFYFKLPKE